MKRIMLLLAVVVWAGTAWAFTWNDGVVKTTQKLTFPIKIYDTLGIYRPAAKPDSFEVEVWSDVDTAGNAGCYFARSGNTTPAWIRRTWRSGDSILIFVDSVADLDGDKGNGLYHGVVRAYVQTRSCETGFSFRIADWNAGDSSVVDGSVLAGLSNAISSTTLDDDAITAAKIANGAVDSLTITDATYRAFGFGVWNILFNAAFTAGSMGDSLNNSTYVTNNDSSYVKGAVVGPVATVTNVTNDVGIKSDDTVLYVRHTDTCLYSAVTGTANQVNIKADDTVLYVRHVDTVIYASVTGTANQANIKADDSVLYVRHVDTVVYAITIGTANSANIKPDDTVLYVRHVDTVITSPSGGLDSATTSRILGRKLWGIAAGSGSDSVAATSRYIANPGGSSAGTGTKACSLYVSDTLGPTRARVSTAKVTMQNSDNSNTSPPVLTTNSSGYVIFNADPSTTYNFYAEKGGYYFPVKSITTSAGVTAMKDSVPGYDLVPANTAPGTQKTTLYDTPLDPGANTMPYAKVTLTLSGGSGAYTSTNTVVPSRIVVRANSAGLWEAAVFGNDSLYVAGVGSTTSYDIKIEHSSLVQPIEYKAVFVPANGSTTTLKSLID